MSQVQSINLVNALMSSQAPFNPNSSPIRPVFFTPLRGTYDVAVIGGGAVGLSTAMAILQQHNLSLVVLEAENMLAAHQTGHNSGVIHSGLYYKPGSLKARLCVEGRAAMYEFCQEHNIVHQRCGKIVVATRAAELPGLDELERRGQANGLTGIKRLAKEEIGQYEPYISGIAALHVPETGIVNYRQVANAFADIVRNRGGEVRTGAKVDNIHKRGDLITLQTEAGEISVRGIINCGGLQSDRVARMCGIDPGVQIVPFRGEYYELAEQREYLIRNLVYPVPDPRFPFLGVHFTRMIDGGIEAGPNAVLALARHGYARTSFNPHDAISIATYSGFWKMAREHWRTGCGEFYRSMSKRAFLRALRRLLPELQLNDLTPGGAGVRAQAVDASGKLVDDFRIVTAPRMVHVLNAPSPAATASISIGRHIAELATNVLHLQQMRGVSSATTGP
jgi:L-2-hydroxyglutarate oxidase